MKEKQLLLFSFCSFSLARCSASFRRIPPTTIMQTRRKQQPLSMSSDKISASTTKQNVSTQVTPSPRRGRGPQRTGQAVPIMSKRLVVLDSSSCLDVQHSQMAAVELESRFLALNVLCIELQSSATLTMGQSIHWRVVDRTMPLNQNDRQYRHGEHMIAPGGWEFCKYSTK